MTTQLDAVRARYNAARDTITEIQTRAEGENRDLTDDELTEIEGHAGTATRAATLVEHLTTEETRTRAVADAAAQVDAGMRGEIGGIPSLLAPPERIGDMLRSATAGEQRRFEVTRGAGSTGGVPLGAPQHRATVTLAETGTPTMPLGSGSGLREPRRLAVAAGLAVEAVTGMTGAVFPVFGEGTADVAPEGAVKPEYDNVLSGTATPQLIAVWTDFTRQAQLTHGTFESRLRAKLAALVARREDRLMVARALGTPGIGAYAATAGQSPADALLAAAALVSSSDVAAEPNLAVIHPADVVALFGGDAVAANGESPSTEMRLRLHGMGCYVSDAVVPGSALVGAWQAAATYVVGMRPTYLVDSMSGLKTNTVTVLLEEAVTLAVSEPEGFVNVDLTAAV